MTQSLSKNCSGSERLCWWGRRTLPLRVNLVVRALELVNREQRMKGDDIAARLLEFAFGVLQVTTRQPANVPGRHLAASAKTARTGSN